MDATQPTMRGANVRASVVAGPGLFSESKVNNVAHMSRPAKGAVRCDPPAAPLPRQRNKRFEDRPDPHVKRNLLARGAPWIEPTQPVRSCTRTHAHRRFQDQ